MPKRKRKLKQKKPSAASDVPIVQLDSKQLQIARIASAEGRLDEAQLAWLTLEKQAPNESEPPLRLAHIYMQTGRVYDARQATRRGIQRVGKGLLDRCRTAELLTLLDAYPEAIKLLRSVTQEDPGYARAWRVLATALERVNQTDEAMVAADHAIGLDPTDLPAMLTRARLLHRDGRQDEAISLLSEMLNGPVQNPQTHVSILYELASAFDAAQRYEEAWEACGRAKDLLRPYAAPYLAAADQSMEMCQYFSDHATAQDYRQWSERTLAPLPFRLAFLVGHPRSGTTLVEKRLVKATEAVDIDEQPFIGIAVDMLLGSQASHAEKFEQVRSATRSTLEEIRKRYVRMISEQAGCDIAGGLVLDKHPEIIRYLPLLARLFPEADIIAVQRDLRDVTLSCYMLSVPLGPVTASYLEIDTIVARYRKVQSMMDTVSENMTKPLIKIQYETFVEQPTLTLNYLIDALGWPIKDGPDSDTARETHARSPSYASASNPTNTRRVGRWRNYKPLSRVETAGVDH